MIKPTVLSVLLHDKPVGTLTNLQNNRTFFAFNDNYINDSGRPTLGLGFKDEFGNLITDFRSYQARIYPFFSNLLPEGHLRKYLAENAGVNPEREFFLLQALGNDLPGAIKICSIEEEFPFDFPELIENNEYQDFDSKRVLRFSLAGVQLKFSAFQDARGGFTIPGSGMGGSWIIKFPSYTFEALPENEFSMMTLAAQIGINVPNFRLVEVTSIANLPPGIEKQQGQAFVIERFDRSSEGNRLVHIEDFAQIFGIYPAMKYKKATMRRLAKVLAAEGNETDLCEFIRRIVFNVLIGNGDMHLKNWSVIYLDQYTASLAPAYDFLSTVPYIHAEDMALKVSRTKKFNEFTSDELVHLAAKSSIPKKLVLDTAMETVELFHQIWTAEKKNLPMTANVRKAIETHLATIPIYQT